MKPSPPMITPGFDSIAEFEGDWYVAHTKSRFEKSFAEDLRKMGVNYFLPMREKVYVSSGKKRKSVLPLFTSYVFFCSEDPEIKTKVFRTNRIASVMDVVERERFVSELSAIEAAIKNDMTLSTVESLPVGQSCRVVSGVMLGTEGVVVEHLQNKAKVVLEVSVLGKGVEMELDSSMIEKI